ncbi:SGNH hydrolase domain-containing protein [Klebsiella aerogenes]|uniref:SGNH hydrolase domain-containing protein n=1 Tax=Klebsiella aerogenes TaxID=548 RepID=UPI0018662BFE|nr:SGNH hydrolase domain-containing protein [Klebsiella aerogenes]HEP1062511.1 hypothetical protein [Klebsiella aerogenes]
MDNYSRNYKHTDIGSRQFGSKPYSCFYTDKDGHIFDFKNCITASNSKENILLLGDSHMADMSLAFKEEFRGHNVMQATLSSCAMVPGTARTKKYDEFTDRIYNELKNRD